MKENPCLLLENKGMCSRHGIYSEIPVYSEHYVHLLVDAMCEIQNMNNLLFRVRVYNSLDSKKSIDDFLNNSQVPQPSSLSESFKKMTDCLVSFNSGIESNILRGGKPPSEKISLKKYNEVAKFVSYFKENYSSLKEEQIGNIQGIINEWTSCIISISNKYPSSKKLCATSAVC